MIFETLSGLLPRELFIARQPLLSYKELKPAETIDVDSLSQEELFQLYELGRKVSTKRGHVAVAYTQLPDEFFDKNTPKFKNVIFTQAYEDSTLPEGMIVNPTIEIPDDANWVASIEGCGSLPPQLYMVMLRPKTVILNGIAIDRDGNKSPLSGRIVDGITSLIIEHESHHLQGKTALDYPDRFVDFPNVKKSDWNGFDAIYRMNGRSVPKMISNHIKEGINRWLVYRNDRFVVISPDGKELYTFS